MGRVSSVKGDDVLTQANLLEADYARRLQVPASYTVWKQDSVYYADHCFGTGTDYSGADAAAVIQAAIDALPSAGGVIFVKGEVGTGSTEISVTKSNVTIISDKFHKANVGTYPQIDKIKIDASSGTLYNIKISGFHINKLTFYAQTNAIQSVKLENCVLRNSDAYDGSLVFSGNSYVMLVSFVDCRFHEYATTGNGFVQFSSSAVGTAQIFFERCSYQTQASSANVLFYINGRCCIQLHNFSYELFHAGHTFMKVKTDSIIPDLKISDGWFEIHENATLFDIEAKTTENKMAFNLCWQNNLLSTSGGKTTTFLNNGNDDWDDTNFKSGVTMADGCILGGTFSLGTTGQNTEFKVDIHNVRGYNPQVASTPGVGASPVTFGPYPYATMIGVDGGNVTSVTIRGQATGQAGNPPPMEYYILHPGDTCVIVYVAAPTVYLYPQ